MTTESSLDGGYAEHQDAAAVRPGHPLRWRRLLVGLGLVHALVVGFSLIAPLLTGQARGETLFSVYFDVNYEGNFPTWWAVVQLAAATTTLSFVAVLARHQRIKGAAAWWILAGMVFLLCLDEGTWLHERLDALAGQFVDVADFTFVWLVFGIPIGLVVLLLAVVSARHLPEGSTRLIVLGIATLLFAAVGLEFVAGEVIRLGAPTAALAVLYHLEEFLELVAGALLLVAPLAAVRTRTAGRSTSFTLMDRSRR
ncbi:hypothetical protein [Arthrobacter tumbae]|uniref:hypothetical protein n=1 Tax=Arthrobacter tumbae TaxID=163874 RepID=UPI00195C04D5|nr:hypothetical protein [Arthrobacter tumbae]MBM7781516.1 hypothetical protein [Arthrobacter tumbae]